MGKRVLYISGSIGLGHVWRDIAIARALRVERPDVEIEWLADRTSAKVLKDVGEKMAPTDSLPVYGNEILESDAVDYYSNLTRWFYKNRKGFPNNAIIFEKVTKENHYDAIVGDEIYDILIVMGKRPELKKAPMAIMWDFIGFDCVTPGVRDRLLTYMFNRMWSGLELKNPIEKKIYIGEEEDVPETSFGVAKENRREFVHQYYDTVGYILPFDPKPYLDKKAVRSSLGYGKEPLIVASVGGTAAGGALLDLSLKAFPMIRQKVPDARMVLVTGPRYKFNGTKVPEGAEVVGYVPELFKHLAAADYGITSGGGTTTLELTALRTPFAYFPLEGHFEQETHVAERCRRTGAGTRFTYSKTKPEDLAKAVVEGIGKPVTYPPIRVDGAVRAAKVINQLLT